MEKKIFNKNELKIWSTIIMCDIFILNEWGYNFYLLKRAQHLSFKSRY